MKATNKRNIILFLSVLAVLAVGVFALILNKTRTDTRGRAAFGSVTLALQPSGGVFRRGQNVPINMVINAGNYRVSAAQLKLKFNPGVFEYISVTPNPQTLPVKLGETVTVDPTDNYKVLRYTAYNTPLSNEDLPTGTFTVATVVLRVINNAPLSETQLSLEGVQITGHNPDSQDKTLTSSPVSALYSVVDAVPTATQSPNPTITPTSFNQPSATPIPNPTITPTLSSQPSATPFPTLSAEGYNIPIGTKQKIEVAVNSLPQTDKMVHLGFIVKIIADYPAEIKARVKVVDLGSFLTPSASLNRTSCLIPAAGEYFFTDVLLTPSGNIESDGFRYYVPKGGSRFKSAVGEYSVTTDGFLPLAQIIPGRVYRVYVKGEKHRNTQIVSSVVLNEGKTNTIYGSDLIEPGDLPNPSQNYNQDCVVNGIDLSLISNLLPQAGSQTPKACCNSEFCSGRSYDSACPDWINMTVADVNYDGVVNAGDWALVIRTLSTKPDDD